MSEKCPKCGSARVIKDAGEWGDGYECWNYDRNPLQPSTCRVRELEAANRELHDDLSFWEALVEDDDTADWPHRDPRFRSRVEEKLLLAARLKAALRPFAERVAQLVGRDTDSYAVSLSIGEWRAAAAAMAGRLRPESVCEEAAQAAERQEECEYCGDYVTEWTEPEWARGRICGQCRKREEAAQAAEGER